MSCPALFIGVCWWVRTEGFSQGNERQKVVLRGKGVLTGFYIQVCNLAQWARHYNATRSSSHLSFCMSPTLILTVNDFT